jgi:hypothetical protein
MTAAAPFTSPITHSVVGSRPRVDARARPSRGAVTARRSAAQSVKASGRPWTTGGRPEHEVRVIAG